MSGMNSLSCLTAEPKSTSDSSESLPSSDTYLVAELLADSKLLSSSRIDSTLRGKLGYQQSSSQLTPFQLFLDGSQPRRVLKPDCSWESFSPSNSLCLHKELITLDGYMWTKGNSTPPLIVYVIFLTLGSNK